MSRASRYAVTAMVTLIGVTAGASAGVGAQQAVDAENRPGGGGGQGEVVRLLDAYAVVQAQEMLALDDKQYGPFVQRFRALQNVRRLHAQSRTRLMQRLQRELTAGDKGADDAVWRQGLVDLASESERAREETAKAVAGVDEILSVRQQVRFRVFEEQMERRRLDLLTRARAGAGAGRAPRRPR